MFLSGLNLPWSCQGCAPRININHSFESKLLFGAIKMVNKDDTPPIYYQPRSNIIMISLVPKFCFARQLGACVLSELKEATQLRFDLNVSRGVSNFKNLALHWSYLPCLFQPRSNWHHFLGRDIRNHDSGICWFYPLGMMEILNPEGSKQILFPWWPLAGSSNDDDPGLQSFYGVWVGIRGVYLNSNVLISGCHG